MNTYELSFGKIIILREDIAEVIINDGIEMNGRMVREYHAFLLSHLKNSFSLLVNKINSYTYDFEAQLNIATLREIKAMAIVSYNQNTRLSTESLATTIPRDVVWNLKIYSNRDEALRWLISEQAEHA